MNVPPRQNFSSRSFVSAPAGDRRGAALIIVLSFVILLSGVIVAFFSRAMSERQLSNGTAQLTESHILSEGAINTIIGDLQEEMVAKSDVLTYGTTVYLKPKTPADLLPERVGTDDKFLNLTKRSVDQAFFNGSNIKRAGSSPLLSSTMPSINGRSISPSRWNKPLFLPRKDITTTTAFDPLDGFVAPQWVLVARDGSNPLDFQAGMSNNAALTSAKFVVGRYAYNIYDEGSLLDMNAAGYPSGTPASGKGNMAFADLTQIPGIGVPDLVTGVQPLATGKQTTLINRFVGTRNFASGAFARDDNGFINPTALTGTAYLQASLANLGGFLISGPATSRVGNALRTDRLMLSRQDLIQLLTNPGTLRSGPGSLVSTEDTVRVQNALQYMTHFSRALNQPSLVRDSALPLVKSQSENDGFGQDKVINPNFLELRATAATRRNDGQLAKAGEPLVLKRFSLNRLAWLTRDGPSAQATGVRAELTRQGIPATLLEEGDDARIGRYFGLQWDAPNLRWKYTKGAPGVRTLAQVAAANEEPNFFELLKASINVGAIGKTSVSGTATLNPPKTNAQYSSYGTTRSDFAPLNIQYKYDAQVDLAIMQIGANMIDQWDADSYPTLIQFRAAHDVAGIENLPYIYRARTGVLKLREADPPGTGTAPVTPAGTVLKDSGLGAFMLIPEVWNPHDQEASLSDVGPQDFRVVAYSTDPDGLDDASLVTFNRIKAIGWKITTGVAYSDEPVNQTKIVGPDADARPTTYLGDVLAPAKGSYITFSIPRGRAGKELFREPTVLFKADAPKDSAMALAPELVTAHPELAGHAVGSGLKSVALNPAREASAPPDNQAWLGIYSGGFPLRWINNAPPTSVETSQFATPIPSGNSRRNAGRARPIVSDPDPYVTLVMEYKRNGNWVRYDWKYTKYYDDACPVPLQNETGGLLEFAQKSGANPTSDCPVWSEWFDPRTPRFGTIPGTYNPPAGLRGAGEVAARDWLDSTQGYIVSSRPESSAGFAPDLTKSGTEFGWDLVKAPGWTNAGTIRWGLMAQNAISVPNDGRRWNGDSAVQAGAGQYYADPDGIVRRGVAGYVPGGAGSSATTTIGLPAAKTFGTGAVAKQSESRPITLNRAFRSVADLGYVFSGTPWKNLDMSMPESGFSGLLDVFTIAEAEDPGAMIAGRVNLNTRQRSVIQAILKGSAQNELDPAADSVNEADASAIAASLLARTRDTATEKGPMLNITELVGRYIGNNLDGSRAYAGFSGDLSTVYGPAGSTPNSRLNNIPRFREAAIRALAAAGQTRVWNLMIDVIAQTGRYPSSANGGDRFVVEGEQRAWVHVALDRFTGEIIDKQIEIVKE